MAYANERVNALAFMRKFRGKTIVFIGDSLTRSWACTLKCALGEYFKFKAATLYSVPKYTYGFAAIQTPHPVSDVVIMFWHHLDTGAAPRWGGQGNAIKVIREGDVVILNVGGHLKDPVSLNGTLYKHFELWQQNKKENSVFMYREESPSHFPSMRGTWTADLDAKRARDKAQKKKPAVGLAVSICAHAPLDRTKALDRTIPEYHTHWVAGSRASDDAYLVLGCDTGRSLWLLLPSLSLRNRSALAPTLRTLCQIRRCKF